MPTAPNSRGRRSVHTAGLVHSMDFFANATGQYVELLHANRDEVTGFVLSRRAVLQVRQSNHLELQLQPTARITSSISALGASRASTRLHQQLTDEARPCHSIASAGGAPASAS